MRELAYNALSTACALACMAVLLPAPSHAADAPSGQDFAEIERGRYLTAVADCAACHTDPGEGQPFAGGRPIETPFGIVAAANITPDRETGIGDWTAQQFDAAVRRGRRPDGKRLYPAMPFLYYTKMSQADVLAIRAYLSTIAPVRHHVETNRLPFPFNIRAGMRFWDALYFDAAPFKPEPAKSPAWNRGAYLVQSAGHCGACHTPKGSLGGDLDKQRLQGYSLQGWFAPNITNDRSLGLGVWSPEDVVEYLKKGHNRIAGASGPMAEEVVHSSSKMTDDDLHAIAAYLKDEPGQLATNEPLSPGQPLMRAGSAIYQDLCAACHRKDGTGVAYLIPNLARSSAVASREPTSLLRVVIRGAQTASTRDEPTGPSMPAFGWQLTDDEIAAVTTYIRNSWGHSAPATAARDVHEARRNLQARGG
jgi:mono/diheme cytochrome c family protein